jgi:hypothetical protein
MSDLPERAAPIAPPRGSRAVLTSGGSREESGARLPDFFIVGHQKCGTTALHMMLRQHPQIFMPTEKEPRYFMGEGAGPRQGSRGRPKTLHEYLDLFTEARPEQLAGEASPQYLRSPVAPASIAKVQPAARIIAILREPARFLYSYHLQMIHSRNENQKRFPAAVELEAMRKRGKRIPPTCSSPEMLFYADHVRYTEQLKRFHAVFPPEQVLVLVYEDFREDNRATLAEVLRFLGVDDLPTVEPVETKPLTKVRFQRLHEISGSLRAAHRNPASAGPLPRAINALTSSLLRSNAVGVASRRLIYSRASAPPPEDFMRELRRRFKPEVEAVSDYLDRDLMSRWGYRDV